MIIAPDEIEKESFEIIQNILDEKGIRLDEAEAPVIKRVIHTTADLSFAETMSFSKGVTDRAQEYLKEGAVIITDTNMALAGINKGRLKKYGNDAICCMSDEDVIREAAKRGVTRAMVSMEKAACIRGPKIFAIGNAPTALIELHSLYTGGLLEDFILIGVPVGFVNVEYSKELFRGLPIPYIINFGRKGGSNVAAAIINALTLMLQGS